MGNREISALECVRRNISSDCDRGFAGATVKGELVEKDNRRSDGSGKYQAMGADVERVRPRIGEAASARSAR